MIVKNILVEDIDFIMDILERELCKRGISYVRIENEIHFQGKIIRFLNFKTDYKKIINRSLAFHPTPNEYEIPNFVYVTEPKQYSKRNHAIHKQESNKVKQILKRFSK